MKLSIVKKWVKALRSGKYKQGKQALKTKSERGVIRHCCLGVLCEVYNKEHKNKLKVKVTTDSDKQIEGNPKTKVFTFGDDAQLLPTIVRKWAGMKHRAGDLAYEVEYPSLGGGSLVDINDYGASFKEIADLIEERYEDL